MAVYNYTFNEYVDYIKGKYPQETSGLTPKQSYYFGKIQKILPMLPLYL